MVYGDPQKNSSNLMRIRYGPVRPTGMIILMPESSSRSKKTDFEGKYKEAHDIVNEKFISKISHGMPYQTMGNLRLTFRDMRIFKIITGNLI